MASNSQFLMSSDSSFLGGFTNLLKKENRRWWGTRLWLIQLVLWVIIINGIVFAIYKAGVEDMYGSASDTTPAEQETIQMMKQHPELLALIPYMRLAGLGLVIGVIVLAQNALISEKQSGTAAWVLSKPVTRSAFVLSKAAGYGLGILGVMGILQGGILYGQIWLMSGVLVPLLPYAGMISLVFLDLLFYLTLCLMLGAFFNSRGAVLGIPFIVLFSYLILPIPAWLAEIMPWNLLDELAHPSLALAVVQGQALPSLAPILATTAWCLLFMAAAIWRFRREEF
jgi:ABC-2 type transport system permease protein